VWFLKSGLERINILLLGFSLCGFESRFSFQIGRLGFGPAAPTPLYIVLHCRFPDGRHSIPRRQRLVLGTQGLSENGRVSGFDLGFFGSFLQRGLAGSPVTGGLRSLMQCPQTWTSLNIRRGLRLGRTHLLWRTCSRAEPFCHKAELSC